MIERLEKLTVCGAMVMMTAVAAAFPEIPKASAKALGVTRGKSFSSGLVFIDGKFLEPPYVVERWGTGIRINSKPVTGQVIDWNEFLKTQTGVKVTKTEVVSTSAPTPVVVSKPAETDYSSALDDLFEDDPKPKKTLTRASFSTAVSVPKPKIATNYELSGDFVKNDASKALTAKINAVRTEIDGILRRGGFICFGGQYSRVTGDSRSALKMLEDLPELQMNSETAEQFRAGVRRANLVYLNDELCQELFRNKVDYRKLQEQRAKIKKEIKWKSMLNDVSSPLL